MQVLAKKRAPSHKMPSGIPTEKEPGQSREFPAPIAGIVESAPIGSSSAVGAEFIENFLPQPRGLRVRGGAVAAADAGAEIVSMFVYDRSVVTPQFFAATQSDILDISSLDPNTVATSVVSGLTSGDWSSQQFGTTGGNFLILANGQDDARVYDGAAWSLWNVTGLPTSSISHVWDYQDRLFMIERDTLKFWYLPITSFQGAATSFSLAGIAKKGGSLLFGATWSLDSSEGLGDLCVFVTDQGEVIVYQGTNPSDATTWALQGRYEIGNPLGKNATMSAGGDLLIATDEGIVPMSAIVQRDRAQLSDAAVTVNIKRTWERMFSASGESAQLIKWTSQDVMLVISSSYALTSNLTLGSWAHQTGWSGRCVAIFRDSCYIGRSNGKVYRLNSSGEDDGQPFTARVCFPFTDFGDAARVKSTTIAKCSFLSDGDFSYRVDMAKNYGVSFPPPPALVNQSNSQSALWDVSFWDVSFWGTSAAEPQQGRIDRWRSAVAQGYALAPLVQVSSSGANRISAELTAVDVIVAGGGVA